VLMYGLKSMDLDEADDDAEGSEVKTGWINDALGGEEDTKAKLRMWLSRLSAHSTALGRLAGADYVDREAVDEEVHGIDFLLDSARRLCRGAEPMDKRHAKRLRRAVAELVEDIQKMQKMDEAEVQEIDRQLRAAGSSLLRVHQCAENATFRRWGAQPSEKAAESSIPWGLVFAVVVDACVDGMLIGLAGSVSRSSGWLMAAATTFEMGFLGYSFACSIVKSGTWLRSAMILALPPLAMVSASALACVGAVFLHHSAAFAGLIAFSMVAVLFLVFQELLLEAQHNEEGGEWHISLWLYAGLLMSIYLDLSLA